MQLTTIACGLAAIDHEGVTGHKLGVITGEKGKGAGNVFWAAQAPNWDQALFVEVHKFGWVDLGGHWRQNVTGRHRVDANVARSARSSAIVLVNKMTPALLAL